VGADEKLSIRSVLGPPDLLELSFEEEVVEFVLPAFKLLTDGANDKGLTLSMLMMMDLSF
jgi:hypothetical protein